MQGNGERGLWSVHCTLSLLPLPLHVLLLLKWGSCAVAWTFSNVSHSRELQFFTRPYTYSNSCDNTKWFSSSLTKFFHSFSWWEAEWHSGQPQQPAADEGKCGESITVRSIQKNPHASDISKRYVPWCSTQMILSCEGLSLSLFHIKQVMYWFVGEALGFLSSCGLVTVLIVVLHMRKRGKILWQTTWSAWPLFLAEIFAVSFRSTCLS